MSPAFDIIAEFLKLWSQGQNCMLFRLVYTTCAQDAWKYSLGGGGARYDMTP